MNSQQFDVLVDMAYNLLSTGQSIKRVIAAVRSCRMKDGKFASTHVAEHIVQVAQIKYDVCGSRA